MPFTNDPPSTNALAVGPPTAVDAAGTANVNLAAERAAIDGVTVAAGRAILLTAQTATETKGIYIADAGTNYWRRPTTGEVGYGAHVNGLRVTATYGTSNRGKLWTLTTANPIVLDTTPLTFALSLSAGASKPETLTGMTFSNTPPNPNTIS